MSIHQNLNNNGEHSLIISYLTLRRAVGILGIALPWVLIASFSVLNRCCQLPPSISHYYFTNVGTYFTGTLCAVGLFLFSYKGPNPKDQDRKAALFASACALLVAFFPTNDYANCCNNCILVNLGNNHIRNAVHYGSATLLFSTLAYFSLKLFTKTSTEKNITKEKQIRNRIYKFCGWTIVVCIAVIGLSSIPAIAKWSVVKNFRLLTFVFEAIALNAFGYSWLIKGETFFKDKKIETAE